jgi:hypothetical protein
MFMVKIEMYLSMKMNAYNSEQVDYFQTVHFPKIKPFGVKFTLLPSIFFKEVQSKPVAFLTLQG